MTVSLIAGSAFGLGIIVVSTALSSRSPLGPGHILDRIERGQDVIARMSVVLGAAILAFAVSGWPVGGVLGAAAALAIPSFIAGQRRRRDIVLRTEAVAAWSEMLRDTMAGAAGLEEALVATADLAPPRIRDHVRQLALRIRRDSLAAALHSFAHDVGDPAADVIVVALTTARERQTNDLGALLDAVAVAARREAAARLRIEAARARIRTAVQVVTLTTVGFAAGLVVFSRDFLAPYDTAAGQVWLVLVGSIFAAAISQLRRMMEFQELPRLLAAHSGEAGGAE